MFTTKTRTATAALIVAIAALMSSGVASAATHPAHRTLHRSTHGRQISRVVKRGGVGPVVKPVVGSTFAAITAFPTGGKGSGTEATCALWSGRLNEEQGAVEAAEDNNDVQQYKDSKESLDEDVDNALDAGCAVIY